MRATAPVDGCPDPLVQIVPGDFGGDFEASNRPGDRDPARHEPADGKGVERSKRPPTDGFEDRPRVRLCAAEQ